MCGLIKWQRRSPPKSIWEYWGGGETEHWRLLLTHVWPLWNCHLILQISRRLLPLRSSKKCMHWTVTQEGGLRWISQNEYCNLGSFNDIPDWYHDACYCDLKTNKVTAFQCVMLKIKSTSMLTVNLHTRKTIQNSSSKTSEECKGESCRI